MSSEIIIDSDFDICDSASFSPNSLPPEIPRIEAEMDASEHGYECPDTFHAPCKVMTNSSATRKRARDTGDLGDEDELHKAAVRRCDHKEDAARTKAKAKAHNSTTQQPRLTKLNLNLNPILPGITAGNVPIPPPGTTSKTIRYYLSCPVLRRLDWRSPRAPTPATADSKHWVGDTADLEAAFVQTRGLIAKRPCAGCSAGRGLWKSCVERLGKKNNGICANCWQAGEFCTNFNKALTPREMASTLRPRNRLNSAEQVVPFPLEIDAIDSLSILRRTEQEAMAHLVQVQTRIAQLEKHKKEAAAEAELEEGEISWDGI
ncbi:hypothetical protein BDW71DRAFT_208293 [Aspergillus fruticulosus]